ncbi:hypothetical protein FNH05_10345 [Amycolatopsis rhizosphaerae]|uniref:DUF1444 family protein n=1 Tax=Amycolatopsis rhizosphaerae TaxID=2053003 RepID=A0A558D0X1_9PSEU|nr:hypothetical protein [Amycolatopsis rhizosphaerae]TVT54652.1 hypothetical protein FNH05_10345 [Amycolatopsis rhizosphaerae]
MDLDVTMNNVVFQLNGDDNDLVIAAAPAQAQDSVRQAWRQAQRERPVQASEVTRVHSTWQASRTDGVFLVETFAEAEYTYVFDRPEGDDWTDAFEHARKVMADLDGVEREEGGREKIARAERDGEWLPILHSTSAPLRLSASLPLVEGKLYVGFAKVTITPEGRIGMAHLLRSSLEAMSDKEYLELAGEACDNLKRGLTIRMLPDEEHGNLAVMERNGPCAGSAIMLPDFHENVAGMVGADRLIVGLVSPDHIYIAGEGSGRAEEIREAVLTSPDTGSELVPSLLRVDTDGMDVIAERPV